MSEQNKDELGYKNALPVVPLREVVVFSRVALSKKVTAVEKSAAA